MSASQIAWRYTEEPLDLPESPERDYFITHAPGEWTRRAQAVERFIAIYSRAALWPLVQYGLVPENLDRTCVGGTFASDANLQVRPSYGGPGHDPASGGPGFGFTGITKGDMITHGLLQQTLEQVTRQTAAISDALDILSEICHSILDHVSRDADPNP